MQLNPNLLLAAIVTFPLTPALSLGEREKPWQRVGKSGASGIFERRATMPPLPKGWGIGIYTSLLM